ncbi:hypothetical protein HU200_066838 [Digitaria exilis]|uniref:Signal peptidase complex catalytic subunit SEC11 n=1 Tax=Digitaria exilis TaxID=1010633 RepID=A0A835DWC4_9POAL|nr:hypothetical protein HU200_066838 [Digitaria exilis]
MDNQSILRRLVPRRACLSQLVLLGLLLAHALMAYTAAEAAAGTSLTTRVILSGSMEPAFERGDLLLFREGDDDPIRVGDVVLFQPTYGTHMPVVHRVIAVHERRGGGADILTKGDNNFVDDSTFMYRGPWLPRQHVMAKAVGYLPKAGWFSLVMNENPRARKIVAGVLGLGQFVTAPYY